MTTTPKFAGIGCLWGVSSVGITGYGALVIQSTDQSSDADTETAQDPTGFVVTDVTYNHRETATLETWMSGSSGGAITLASSSYPQPGDTVTITDATNTALAGTTWIAGTATVRRSNTSLAKVSIQLRRYAKI